ncbi:hypothetical protein BC833DRAFT_574446 [Globomyces pollinis-pini]|nr:hypothetical protein BC833DRAFT_574446 [Globomyces pollinis-pini]
MTLLASNNVTKGLKEAVSMMSNEIEKSQSALENLDNSTRTISGTSDVYGVMGDLLQNSKSLLKKLKNKDQYDRILLGIGLIIFSSTVIYIFWKRSWLSKLF